MKKGKMRILCALMAAVMLLSAFGVSAAAEEPESTALAKPAVVLTTDFFTNKETSETSVAEGVPVWPLINGVDREAYTVNSYWQKLNETTGSYEVHQTILQDGLWTDTYPVVQPAVLGQGITPYDPGTYKYWAEVIDKATGAATVSDAVVCTVYAVNPAVEPESIQLLVNGEDIGDEITLGLYESVEITAKVLPDDADYRWVTWIGNDLMSMLWISMDTNSANPTAGNTKTLMGYVPGKTTVVVKTADGDLTRTFDVTITAPKPIAPSVTLNYTLYDTMFGEGDFLIPTWTEDSTASHYNVYLEKENAEGEYKYYSDYPKTASGMCWVWLIEPGNYAIKVEAVNTGGLEDEALWGTSDSGWTYFTVMDYAPEVPAEEIIVPEEVVIEVGEIKRITAEVRPENAEYLPLNWFCLEGADEIVSYVPVYDFNDDGTINYDSIDITGLKPGTAAFMVATGEGDALAMINVAVKAAKPAIPDVTLFYTQPDNNFMQGDLVSPSWIEDGTATHYNVYWEKKNAEGNYEFFIVYFEGKPFESYWWMTEPGDYRIMVEAVNTGGVEDETLWAKTATEWIEFTVIPVETDNPAQEIVVSDSEVVLSVGETKRVTATVLPEDAEYRPLVWYCDDITVAQHMSAFDEVNALDITGLKPGKTYIMVAPGEGSEGGAVANINVTVTAAKPGKPIAMLGAGSEGIENKFIEGDYCLPFWTPVDNATQYNSVWEKQNAEGVYEVYSHVENDQPLFVEFGPGGGPIWLHEEGNYRYKVVAVNNGGVADEALWSYTESDYVNFVVEEYIPAKAPTGIELPTELVVLVGKTETLAAKIVPEGADYRHFAWFYLSEDIANVAIAENMDSAQITGLKPGEFLVVICTADGDQAAASLVKVVEHLLTEVPADAATCMDTGIVAHWHCSDCGKNFADAEGKVELESVVAPLDKNNHVGGTEVRGEKEATYTEPGYTGDTCCLGCDAVLEAGSSIPVKLPAPAPNPGPIAPPVVPGGSGGGSGSSGGGASGGQTEPETPAVPDTPETPAPEAPLVPEVDIPAVDTSAPAVSTETVEREDGSTVVTETKENGVVVETTTNTDGSKVETATKTETVETETGKTTTTATTTTTEDASGAVITENKEEVVVETAESKTTTTTSKTETVDAEGMTKTETKVEEKIETATGTTATTTTTTETAEKTEKVEVKEETVIAEDGTAITTTTSKTDTALANGSTGTTVVDETGKVKSEVSVSETAVKEAAESGASVALPMPAVPVVKDTDSAPTVTVSTNSAESVAVEIPVENVSAGVVVVIVEADGTETVVKNSVVSENGVVAKLPDGATVKVMDKSREFADVGDNDWHNDAVDFATSRDLFEGVSDESFAPASEMTAGMLMTVLARLDGQDTTAADGQSWQDPGVEWAVEMGVHDGSEPDKNITREEIALMLWKYSGSPASEASLDGYRDAGEADAQATEALRWAVENGVMEGPADGVLDPKGEATRAQVAQFMKNFAEKAM